MSFTVHVAADIFSNKTNFELTFPSRPTLVEMTQATETAFSNEILLRRPANVPQHSFHVAKLKAYDEETGKWTDVSKCIHELQEYTQIYAFQPENPWHKESRMEIPPAVKPPSASVVSASNSSIAPVSIAGGVSVGSKGSPYTSGGAVGATGAGTTPTPYAASHNNTDGLFNRSTGALVPVNNGGSAANVSMRSNAMMPRVSVNATEDEKLRIVFAEFDVKGNRVIDMEDLKQGFRSLGLEFTTATMNDLFQKGDTNNDGRITFSEFERFSRLYPIMMDCLFFRSKAFWDEEVLAREIQAEREAVRQAVQAVQKAEQTVQQAQGNINMANDNIMSAEAEVKDHGNRLRDLGAEMERATGERERAQRDRQERENELNAVRERERLARQEHQGQVREVEKQERRAATLENDVNAAEERVRQLQQALADAQHQLERAGASSRQAQQDVESARAREKDALRNAELIARDLPKLDNEMRMADRNVVAAADRLKELDNTSREVSRFADEAMSRRDGAERALQVAKEHEAQMLRDLERSKQYADEREGRAKAREDELEEQRRQRQLVTAHERALIEQELRLREQRDTLEERENKLRNEATNFLGNLRTAAQNRSYSRDASVAGHY